MKKNMRYTIAFDLDNTLCESIRRWHPEDILKVKPRKKMIKIVKELKKRGHEIIIFTRRGSLKTGRKLTIRWLKKYNIPYDKLITKKPRYDLLVDDRVFSVHQSYITSQVIESWVIYTKKSIKKHLYKSKKKEIIK